LEKERSALLITYYWPPAGGAGVHRWLRFSKYFKENGWKLHVYCPEDAAWPTLDPALQSEVSPDLLIIRRKIFEPHKFLGKKNNPNVGAGLTQTGKSSLIQRMIIWVRGNLFIPDARKFWICPSARFLNRYLKAHPEIETIISTGPPHSMHLIAEKIKRKHNIKWIADFRDPWTDIDFYQDLLPGKYADAKHKRLEKLVLTKADKVVTVSSACSDGLEKIAGRKVEIITNGFIFPEFDASKIDLDEKFTIAHFGSMPFARNPEVLWRALNELNDSIPHFSDKLQIKIIGSVDYKVLESLKTFGLENYVKKIDPIPHAESIAMQRKTQLLLLVTNNTGNVKGILTGKFFEYLGAKRPIIAIGEKDSDLQNAMDSTKAGLFADYADIFILKNYLTVCFDQFEHQNLLHQAENIEQFSSQHLAKKFISMME